MIPEDSTPPGGKTIFFCLIIFSFIAVSGAKAQEVLELSLRDAVKSALKHNLAIKRSTLSAYNIQKS